MANRYRKSKSNHDASDQAKGEDYARQPSYWNDITVSLNYLFSEHFVGLILSAFGIGFIFLGLALQASVTARTWYRLGWLFLASVPVIAVARTHVIRKRRAKRYNHATEKKLPGFSLHLFVRIHNLPVMRRKYILDLGHIDRERLSIYISPDNIFTLSYVDAKAEHHPVQIPLGDGLQIGQFLHLCCELGISGSTTEVRVFADESNIGSLMLPFKTDAGSLDIPNGVIGADLTGCNGSAIDLAELIAYPNTLLACELKRNCEYLKSKPNGPYLEFDGTKWMRIANAAKGSRHAQQVDPSKSPVYRIPKA